jgi:hypothetical protein
MWDQEIGAQVSLKFNHSSMAQKKELPAPPIVQCGL